MADTKNRSIANQELGSYLGIGVQPVQRTQDQVIPKVMSPDTAGVQSSSPTTVNNYNVNVNVAGKGGNPNVKNETTNIVKNVVEGDRITPTTENLKKNSPKNLTESGSDQSSGFYNKIGSNEPTSTQVKVSSLESSSNSVGSIKQIDSLEQTNQKLESSKLGNAFFEDNKTIATQNTASNPESKGDVNFITNENKTNQQWMNNVTDKSTNQSTVVENNIESPNNLKYFDDKDQTTNTNLQSPQSNQKGEKVEQLKGDGLSTQPGDATLYNENMLVQHRENKIAESMTTFDQSKSTTESYKNNTQTVNNNSYVKNSESNSQINFTTNNVVSNKDNTLEKASITIRQKKLQETQMSVKNEEERRENKQTEIKEKIKENPGAMSSIDMKETAAPKLTDIGTPTKVESRGKIKNFPHLNATPSSISIFHQKMNSPPHWRTVYS